MGKLLPYQSTFENPNFDTLLIQSLPPHHPQRSIHKFLIMYSNCFPTFPLTRQVHHTLIRCTFQLRQRSKEAAVVKHLPRLKKEKKRKRKILLLIRATAVVALYKNTKTNRKEKAERYWEGFLFTRTTTTTMIIIRCAARICLFPPISYHPLYFLNLFLISCCTKMENSFN